jgi:hypothetical protein
MLPLFYQKLVIYGLSAPVQPPANCSFSDHELFIAQFHAIHRQSVFSALVLT